MDGQDADQIGRMSKLILVFAGCTSFVGFVMPRLIFQASGTDNLQYKTRSLFSPGKYRKNPKNLDIQKICCNHPTISTARLYYTVILLKDAEGIVNSVDPDQTAPLGAA